MKLSPNCSDYRVLRPTFLGGRAIIIILLWSRQLSAYLQLACHALFTTLALKGFFFPLPLSIPIELITLLNKHCCLPVLPDRAIIPPQTLKAHMISQYPILPAPFVRITNRSGYGPNVFIKRGSKGGAIKTQKRVLKLPWRGVIMPSRSPLPSPSRLRVWEGGGGHE